MHCVVNHNIFYAYTFQRIFFGHEVHIDHVACGSAHSVAWSSMKRKVSCPLPKKVPMEFNHLQVTSMSVLRNRLILLQHFSSLFCKSLTLFTLQSSQTELGSHETEFGYDNLRGIIMSSAKVGYRCTIIFYGACW